MLLSRLEVMSVTDAGLKSLTKQRNLELWALDISFTPITDAGLEYLQPMATQGFFEIHLEYTKVTADGVEKLCKVLPNCLVIWTDSTHRLHKSFGLNRRQPP